MTEYKVSLNNVIKGGRFPRNSIVFLRETYSSYEEAKEAAVINKKANIWVRDTVVCVYNVTYGFLEKVTENKHAEI